MKTFKTFMAVIATVLVSTSAMAQSGSYDFGGAKTQKHLRSCSYTMSDKALDSKLPGGYKMAHNDDNGKDVLLIMSDGTFNIVCNNTLSVGHWTTTNTPGVYSFETSKGERFEMSFFGQYLVDQAGQMWDRAK